jgi:6,7-dimethyl-8-ribityllumazine synthase
MRNDQASVTATGNIPRIAYIEAGWHHDIVAQARKGFCDLLQTRGIPEQAVELFNVPGSLEIPLKCQRLARQGHHDIVVAAGLIVDGGIYRHDFVAASVLDAMMRVQLENDVPVLSIVLTPHQFSTDAVHHDFYSGHFLQKGAEAAEACLMVLQDGSRPADFSALSQGDRGLSDGGIRTA